MFFKIIFPLYFVKMLTFFFFSLQSTLPFKYDLERVIDDWVLLVFLVGNDFIPHLPNMHINHVRFLSTFVPFSSMALSVILKWHIILCNTVTNFEIAHNTF